MTPRYNWVVEETKPRKTRRRRSKKKPSGSTAELPAQLEQVNLNAAGIDVGATEQLPVVEHDRVDDGVAGGVLAPEVADDAAVDPGSGTAKADEHGTCTPARPFQLGLGVGGQGELWPEAELERITLAGGHVEALDDRVAQPGSPIIAGSGG